MTDLKRHYVDPYVSRYLLVMVVKMNEKYLACCFGPRKSKELFDCLYLIEMPRSCIDFLLLNA